MFPEHLSERAVDYLLEVLNEQSVVKYSEFYDGSSDCHEQLVEALGLDESEDESVAELLMDYAAYLLEEEMMVYTLYLDERLSDGSLDYEIVLTQTGREVLAGEGDFRFFDFDR